MRAGSFDARMDRASLEPWLQTLDIRNLTDLDQPLTLVMKVRMPNFAKPRRAAWPATSVSATTAPAVCLAGPGSTRITMGATSVHRCWLVT